MVEMPTNMIFITAHGISEVAELRTAQFMQTTVFTIVIK